MPLSYFYGLRSTETLHLPGLSIEVPAWLPTDRTLLDLWHEWGDDLCPSCGQHLSEHAGRTWRDYEGHVDLGCPLAEARERHGVTEARRRGDKVEPDPSRWTTVVHLLPERLTHFADHIRRLLTT